MARNNETALAQMKRSVENLGSSTQNYGEQTLMRFLIARSMDPQKAAKMFCQWEKWRAEMVPQIGYIPDSEVPDELATEKVYLQELSRKGHPVMIVKVKKHFPPKDKLQFKKFIVHVLDKTIASSFKGSEIGNEKLIAIVDLQNISYSNVDTRGLTTGFQFIQDYYPERLGTCYLLHMPQFFVTVWRIVSRILDKATQQKIRILKSEEMKEVLTRDIGEDFLPEEYGGRAKLVRLQDVAVNYN